MARHIMSMVLLVFIVFVHGVARSADTHAITKEQLLPLLGKPDVIIIDVSSNEGWDSRDKKIPGA